MKKIKAPSRQIINVSLLIFSFILIVIGCTKTANNPSTTTATTIGSNSNVAQKNYFISLNDQNRIVRDFKGNANLKATSQASIPADSAIWLVETVLNFDFDSLLNVSNSYKVDSCFITVALDNSEITSSQLAGVYNSFYGNINSKISSTNYIKMVDISANIIGNNICFKAYFVMFKPENGGSNRTNNRCAGFPISSGWGNVSNGYSCHNNTEIAPDLMNGFLNCNYVGPYTISCPCNNPYYTNISTTTLYNYPSAYSFLYYKHAISSCDNTNLSDTQMYTYASGIYNYASSNIPVGKELTNFNVTAQVGVFQPWYVTTWWNVAISYGTQACGRCVL